MTDSLNVKDLLGVEGDELEAAVVETLNDEDLVVAAVLGVGDQVGTVVVFTSVDIQDVFGEMEVVDVVLVVGAVLLLKSPLADSIIGTELRLDDSRMVAVEVSWNED